ncbi:enoyl-CoA hydratase/isomerase family protein [Streptomyces sp. NPDC001292]|uniref:enoyl-CoA hydratase/isomerase family protein n=1 Tax=Streptomyces sp. NPDC001292 TaxID=3364558 RepID=UPI0036C5F8BB
MADEGLLRERRGRVMLLRLNRPDRLNAMNGELLEALHAGLAEVAADPDADALVVTGAGRAFSAGGDVDTLTSWQGLASAERRVRFQRAADLAMRLAELPLPVVAAVNGAAAGAGLDLALGADLCLAGRSASFGSGFVAMGLVPDMGGSWLLPRVVGLSRARRLVLGAERIDAETAREWGMVARVVADDELEATALEAATGMAAAAARPAYTEAKRALLDGARSFADALHLGASTQSFLMDTAEHRRRTEQFRARADGRG